MKLFAVAAQRKGKSKDMEYDAWIHVVASQDSITAFYTLIMLVCNYDVLCVCVYTFYPWNKSNIFY